MWHVYNLIREGDRVTATTFRKIARDSGAGSESERVRIKLTVQVEGVDFDPEGELPAELMTEPHLLFLSPCTYAIRVREHQVLEAHHTTGFAHKTGDACC